MAIDKKKVALTLAALGLVTAGIAGVVKAIQHFRGSNSAETPTLGAPATVPDGSIDYAVGYKAANAGAKTEMDGIVNYFLTDAQRKGYVGTRFVDEQLEMICDGVDKTVAQDKTLTLDEIAAFKAKYSIN